jgi:hypothetical protein
MVGWKNLITPKRDAMNLQEFLLEEHLLNEGVKHFKLSDKIKKLLEILEGKRFIKSTEDDMNALDKAELALREMYPAIKKIEKDWEKKVITKAQALEKIRKFKVKAEAVKKYLQDKKVLKKVDWRFLITTGLSLVWLPMVLSRGRDLANFLFPENKQ